MPQTYKERLADAQLQVHLTTLKPSNERATLCGELTGGLVVGKQPGIQGEKRTKGKLRCVAGKTVKYDGMRWLRSRSFHPWRAERAP
jgi:uncharacterized protein YbbK (DUF523 family)